MYIEVIIIFNIYIDFLVLLLTSILIKQKIPLKKLLFISLISGLSSIILFLNITIIELLIISFLISILIIELTFKKMKALLYFYLNSILIGGIIFLVNNFIKLSTLDNYLVLTLITPIIIIIYKKKIKDLKENYTGAAKTGFWTRKYKGKKITLNSFLDTGNNLTDPYFNKPVILVNEDIIKSDKYFYIPYSTITEDGIIKAIHINEIEIIGFKKVKDVIIGLLPKRLQINNIDCLLNKRIMEEIWIY